MTIEDLIIENERRKKRNGVHFDPISGEGSVGKRFLLERNGYRLWLPESMKTIPALSSMPESRFDQLRILHDFPYWAAKYAYIKSKGGGEDRLFVLNRPQRILVDRFEIARNAGRPIRLILLKARQWGGSTCVQLYMAWLQLVHQTGLNSLIIAHQRTATDEIKDMFDRLIKGYPADLLCKDDPEADPKGKKVERVGNAGSTTRIPVRNCKIKVGSAERPDSCRGGDYNLVHCSEVGIWKSTPSKTPEDIARAAGAGILLRPLTMIVYESTANGTGNFFHREYESAKSGLSQFDPLFISWFDIDQYALEIPDVKKFASDLIAKKDSDGVVSDRQQPGAYLWWLWEKGATLEAIAWYISERSKYSDHALMAAEYPSDDIEAFAHSGTRVFDRYCVETLRESCRPPLYIGEIDSPLIPRSGLIADREFKKKQLSQARFIAGKGAWQIWKAPQYEKDVYYDSRYVAVVDVGGRSAKADWSVIVIFDREPMTRGEGPEVVAQWRGHTDFDILAWRAALAASLYDDALLVIESNSIETRDPNRITDGDQSYSLLNRIRDVYPNLYTRRQSEEDIKRGAPSKFGFHTNVATKGLIITTLVEVIREGLYKERDSGCIDEFLSYERRQDGSLGAIAGCHDDMLMTRAIGLHIIYHELPLLMKTFRQSSSVPPSIASLSSLSGRVSGSFASIW